MKPAVPRRGRRARSVGGACGRRRRRGRQRRRPTLARSRPRRPVRRACRASSATGTRSSPTRSSAAPRRSLVRSGFAVDGPAVHVRRHGSGAARPCRRRAARRSTAPSSRSRAPTARPRPRTWPRAVVRDAVPHPREPGVVQQRGRPADDAARRAARHRGRRRGARRAPRRRRRDGCASRAPADRGRDERRASRTWRCSARGRRSSRPRPSRSRRCPTTASRSSNADDPVVASFAARTRARVRDRSAGRRGADVRADDVSLVDRDGRASFELRARRRARARVGSRCPASTWCRTRWPPRRSALELDVPLERRRPLLAEPPASRRGGWRRPRTPAGCASSTTPTTRTPSRSPRR